MFNELPKLEKSPTERDLGLEKTLLRVNFDPLEAKLPTYSVQTGVYGYIGYPPAIQKKK